MRRAKQDNLKRKIIALSRDIRRSYLALKLGKSEQDESIQKLFRPITEPLQEIVQERKNDRDHQRRLETIKKEEKKEETEDVDVDDTGDGGDDNQDVFEEVEDLKDPLQQNYPEIAQKPIQHFWSKSDNIDLNYGPIYDSVQAQWRLGSKLMNFERTTGDIIVDNERFRGTEGLYNLIFYKDPEYSEKDLANYRNILDISGVHKDTLGRLKGSSMIKYANIIRPLFSKSHKSSISSSASSSTTPRTGKGLYLTYNDKPVEYIFWDDINELVDRLKLLMASQNAGNTSHNNEIVAILNELKEAGAIKQIS